MTNKAEVCGWQPKGNSGDIPKPPKFNADKLSVEKLQEQLNTAKKALTEIYLDVNETIIDPVFLFHQSQRIAGRALNELGENNEI